MDNPLLQETILALKQEIDPDMPISLDVDECLADDMTARLRSYRIAQARKRSILGVCILMQLAVQRHQAAAAGDNAVLARSILDGDYLLGLYYRWAATCGETALLSYLAPIHKKLHLQLAEGRRPEAVFAEFLEQLCRFIDESCTEGGDSDEAA